jgi:XTP/dITP diphosphohydrolase
MKDKKLFLLLHPQKFKNMKLVFATNNHNKVREISKLLRAKLDLVSLDEMGITEEVPENQDTLEGNASEKARYIYDKYQVNCFADDTGLEVEALNGAPGVYSARYAGESKDSQANITKLLAELAGKENRKAKFRTVISLMLNGNEYFFEGTVEGKIIEERRGVDGFGYDPVFVPDGFDLTFAEMDLSVKNTISHRARATQKLIEFLNQLPD